MATSAERARNARARDAASGLVQLNIRIPAKFALELARIAKWLQQERPRDLSGVVVRDRRGRVRTMALDQMSPPD